MPDHPGRYVPGLESRSINHATLLHLGTYTVGGLPLQFPDEVGNSDHAAVAYLASWKADVEAGTTRIYSNPSLGLLGYATGIAMKDSFADSIEAQLLPRLGLGQTYLHVPSSAMSSYAWGERDGKSVRVSIGPFDAETYGIKTTAQDMHRFVQANIDPHALEPSVRQAVEATQIGY